MHRPMSIVGIGAVALSTLVVGPPARANDAVNAVNAVNQRQPGPPPPRTEIRVDVPSQLMITDLDVIEDRVRTDPRQGPRATWTFAYLIENMAGGEDPSEFALRWLRQWESAQFVNGHVVPARPAIRELITEPWLARSGGRRLDLAKAPFRLLAIVNRMDLRVHDRRDVQTAGEGRFVFGVTDGMGQPLPPIAGTVVGGFTVIFEYELMARSMDEMRQWTRLWHELGRFRRGSREYNQALESITRRFTDRGAARSKPNGSALNQIRTNEVALALPWEMREFVIGSSGQLEPNPVAITPGTVELNGTEDFADLINDYAAEILDGSFALAESLEGGSSLVGPFVAEDFPDWDDRTFTKNVFFLPFFDVPWSAAGIVDNDARHAFALNTCGGCHRDETGTGFLQIGFPEGHDLPRSLGRPAALAGFLIGTEIPDPVEPSTLRRFDDLARRKQDLEQLIASFFGRSSRGEGPVTERHAPRFVH